MSYKLACENHLSPRGSVAIVSSEILLARRDAYTMPIPSASYADSSIVVGANGEICGRNGNVLGGKLIIVSVREGYREGIYGLDQMITRRRWNQ